MRSAIATVDAPADIALRSARFFQPIADANHSSLRIADANRSVSRIADADRSVFADELGDRDGGCARGILAGDPLVSAPCVQPSADANRSSFANC